MQQRDNSENLNFKLRGCGHEDIPLVIGINERTLPENYPLFFYKQILERYTRAFTLAYQESNPKELVGYIMWRTERGPSAFGLKQVKKGHLVSLAVLPEHRRKGVATALMNRSMRVVEDYGIKEYVLEVRVSNMAAINLYENAFGFEKIKIISHYYRDGEDAFYMCKNLDRKGKYLQGSRDMSEEDIVRHYEEKKKRYLCYRCPSCQSLLIKSPGYSLMGSVGPNEESTVKCAFCGKKNSKYDISLGKFDV